MPISDCRILERTTRPAFESIRRKHSNSDGDVPRKGRSALLMMAAAKESLILSRKHDLFTSKTSLGDTYPSRPQHQ